MRIQYERYAHDTCFQHAIQHVTCRLSRKHSHRITEPLHPSARVSPYSSPPVPSNHHPTLCFYVSDDFRLRTCVELRSVWWRFHGCSHMSTLVKSYTLNMYSFSYISYNSIKIFFFFKERNTSVLLERVEGNTKLAVHSKSGLWNKCSPLNSRKTSVSVTIFKNILFRFCL